jgi:hypothetical protein
MTVRVNFSGVQDFTPIPAGVYKVVALEFQENQSESSEYPYYKTTLEISEGDHAGRKLFTNFSLSPKAAWKLREALVAFGESEESLKGDFDLDIFAYQGVECKAAVTQEAYQGNMQNRVTSLAPINAVPKAAKTASAATAGSVGTAKPATTAPGSRRGPTIR